MSNKATLTGRFGDLTGEQTSYLLDLAHVGALASADWPQVELAKVLAEEALRYGVTVAAVRGFTPLPSPINDVMSDDLDTVPEPGVQATYCLRCYAEVAPGVRECFDCYEARERRDARNDAGAGEV